MLTKGDDFPIHQTPEPIAYAGSDRNFYDRYFFHGYSNDGELFFAAALGVYPHLNIMDAAFGVRIGGVQYNLHASRHLGMERMDTKVGPIRVDVIEPLQCLRIVVDDPEYGIAADLVFEGRLAPLEEPRVTRRNGPRMMLDFTRMTQLGRYSGWIRAGGEERRYERGGMHGVRDRSWGVRAVGERDPQQPVPPMIAQFHWFWVPIHFADRTLLFYRNEDSAGNAWNFGLVISHDDGRREHFAQASLEVCYDPGTRWPVHGTMTIPTAEGALVIGLVPEARFFMTGLGYMNPDWGHGVNKGPLAIGYDEIKSDEITIYAPPYTYSEAFTRATMTTPDGQRYDGIGSFEALSMGPHAIHGFRDLNDGA